MRARASAQIAVHMGTRAASTGWWCRRQRPSSLARWGWAGWFGEQVVQRGRGGIEVAVGRGRRTRRAAGGQGDEAGTSTVAQRRRATAGRPESTSVDARLDGSAAAVGRIEVDSAPARSPARRRRGRRHRRNCRRSLDQSPRASAKVVTSRSSVYQRTVRSRSDAVTSQPIDAPAGPSGRRRRRHRHDLAPRVASTATSGMSPARAPRSIAALVDFLRAGSRAASPRPTVRRRRPARWSAS